MSSEGNGQTAGLFPGDESLTCPLSVASDARTRVGIFATMVLDFRLAQDHGQDRERTGRRGRCRVQRGQPPLHLRASDFVYGRLAEPGIIYERIAFEKGLLAPAGKPPAVFLCPGPPLLDAVIDLTVERHRDLLKRGTVLVDDRDPGTAPRVLFYLEHAIQDESRTRSGDRRVVSKRLLYVELAEAEPPRHLHYAPYMDYRPLAEDEPASEAILERPECAWVTGELERQAQEHAVIHVVPEHVHEVKSARIELIGKTEAAVKDRLTKEIAYWDHRFLQLQDQEQAGKPGARLHSGEARRRAEDLRARLRQNGWRDSSWRRSSRRCRR